MDGEPIPLPPLPLPKTFQKVFGSTKTFIQTHWSTFSFSALTLFIFFDLKKLVFKLIISFLSGWCNQDAMWQWNFSEMTKAGSLENKTPIFPILFIFGRLEEVKNFPGNRIIDVVSVCTPVHLSFVVILIWIQSIFWCRKPRLIDRIVPCLCAFILTVVTVPHRIWSCDAGFFRGREFYRTTNK